MVMNFIQPRTHSKAASRISVSGLGVSGRFASLTGKLKARPCHSLRGIRSAPLGRRRHRQSASRARGAERALASGPVVPMARKWRTGRQKPSVFEGSGLSPVQLRRATLYPA